MQKATFNSSQTSFFKVVKERTDRYFTENNKHTSGSWRLYTKSVVQVSSAAALYLALLFVSMPAFVSILLCCLLGFNLAVIGFNVMHEGGHQSFSRHGWLNQLSALSLNMLGGNAHFWKVKHNINHHTYTNIDGLDSDIDARPFMRLCINQPRHWFHRFQHYYWVPLYGISYIAWVFYEDFLKYFRKRIAPHMTVKELSAKEHFIFWLTKLLYVGMYLVVPILVVGWIKALIGYVITAFICGLTTSVVFQLAHAVEETEFPVPDKHCTKIEQEWAIHQVHSTANFATKNKVFHWLLGGLNFQIEHHLFPRVSHIHYPEISRFVKETCREFNVEYHEHKTLLRALTSHLLYLKKLGKSNPALSTT